MKSNIDLKKISKKHLVQRIQALKAKMLRQERILETAKQNYTIAYIDLLDCQWELEDRKEKSL